MIDLLPSVIVTSTTAPRGAAGSINALSAVTVTFARCSMILGIMHQLHVVDCSTNETAPLTSATATRCWQLTSGIALSPTMPIASVGILTSMLPTLSGVSLYYLGQAQQRVERRLDRIADRECLDRRLGDIEAASKSRHHLFRLRIGR